MTKKNSGLRLSDLIISGFRGIPDLEISRLGRVTLLTGRNGVGKTTVLEALEVYAAAATYRVLRGVLNDREEVVSDREAERGFRSPVNWFSLFHGHRKWSAEDGELFEGGDPALAGLAFSVGPKSGSERLTLRLRRSSDDVLERWSSEAEASPSQVLPLSLFVSIRQQEEREDPIFHVAGGRIWRTGRGFREPPPEFVCRRIGPGLIAGNELADYWNGVALTPQEDLVVEKLGLVVGEPPERIALLGGKDRTESPRFVVRLASQEERVPLKSLGDGANRFFGLVLALATVEGGMLLIDEAENGIHHRVQESYWSLIFQFARDHDVQVIATTHSWDAVTGFARAARGLADDAALIRLQRDDGGITAVEYTPDEIQVLAEQGIEVR